MPYVWVKPEKFIESPLGLSDVYHCYNEDWKMTWRYQIKETRFESGWTAFDIRELAWVMNAERCAGHTELEHRTLIALAQSAKPLTEWLTDMDIGYEGETG